MVMFNSYVKLPEGISNQGYDQYDPVPFQWGNMMNNHGIWGVPKIADNAKYHQGYKEKHGFHGFLTIKHVRICLC